MINFKKICDINNSDEGKILIAAIDILTSIDREIILINIGVV
jgi:hypothetical protein